MVASDTSSACAQLDLDNKVPNGLYGDVDNSASELLLLRECTTELIFIHIISAGATGLMSSTNTYSASVLRVVS